MPHNLTAGSVIVNDERANVMEQTGNDETPTGSEDAPGFETDIKPHFREFDRNSMLKGFDLWNYADVTSHQNAILERLANGTMPCDGPWPKEQVDVFRRWIAEGSLP